MARRRWLALALAAAAACGGDGGGGGARAPGGPGPIAAENAFAGDAGWRLHQRAAPGQLEGYAGATSVQRGGTVDVHLRSDVPASVRWKLYRMGWYGGAEGRLRASGGPVAVDPQPTPQPSPDTGLLECRWPTTFTITTDPGWTSGVYLVVLTRGDGPQSYVPFVLRDDLHRGAAVVQLSVSTWLAYDGWGGRSLYPPWNGKPGDGPPAQEVSFDRPYDEGSGAGEYFRWEHEFVKWAESRGLDLVYVTNVDLDRDPSLLAGQRLFVSLGHDEYWTAPARDAVEAALAAGTSAAFLSGNAIFWQARLEPSRSGGGERRTLVCYKQQSRTRDPRRGTPLETTQWREPPVNRPENALLGVLTTAVLRAGDAPPWIVTNPGHWIYEGTGVREGDAIPGIVGHETDRRSNDSRRPTPAGTEAVARSPVTDQTRGPDVQEATVRPTDAGGFVFAAGTIQFVWGLAKDGVADGRVQRLTENVFRRAGLAPANDTTLAHTASR
ncbi:MAG TPA: N,N-dimethylformamidase beta subunit family domain-containing protein [Anaeromyxobacter sp.]